MRKLFVLVFFAFISGLYWKMYIDTFSDEHISYNLSCEGRKIATNVELVSFKDGLFYVYRDDKNSCEHLDLDGPCEIEKISVIYEKNQEMVMEPVDVIYKKYIYTREDVIRAKEKFKKEELEAKEAEDALMFMILMGTF
jgi:hypothetical protein